MPWVPLALTATVVWAVAIGLLHKLKKSGGARFAGLDVSANWQMCAVH